VYNYTIIKQKGGKITMTLAQFIISQIIDIYKRAQEEYSKLAQKLSINEQEIQDVLHRVEFEDLDVSSAISLAFKLKCLRVTRRRIKNEISQLQTFLDMLDGQHLNKIQLRLNIRVDKQVGYKPSVLNGNQ
jgi:predicted oxidoreductase